MAASDQSPHAAFSVLSGETYFRRDHITTGVLRQAVRRLLQSFYLTLRTRSHILVTLDIMAYEKVMKDFGLRLAKLRTDAGLTQEKLAFEVHVDRTYISLLERGLRNPTLKRLWKIAKVLKVSLPELVDF